MRFVLPVMPGLRSTWRLRLGLFLYDWLGRRKILPRRRTLDLTHHVAGHPLMRKFRRGFEYSDCRVDDSRLVVLNALDAAERGATIRTRTRLARAEREQEWRLILNAEGHREVATARVVVNATGPWVGLVAETVLRMPGRPRVRLVKGSHIVVPALFDHAGGYILQNDDGRVVFALPFAGAFTLIGTTDLEFKGDLDAVAPSAEEVLYLCRAASHYFRQKVEPDQVVWAFAGVRSLYDDGAGKPEDVTRDYHLTLDEGFRQAPLLTIYGGKITTYRRLAEAALDRLSHFFQLHPPWTAGTPLPGGEFHWDAFDSRVAQTMRTWPFLTESEATRLAHAYGFRVDGVLGQARRREDIAPFFGPLSAAEVRYLVRHEWARNADDVLWRRSKLGLVLNAKEKEALAQFMASAVAPHSPTSSAQ
jgi:glycerol-3-phosphate dehydrogenase